MIVGDDISKWQGEVNFNVYKNNSNFLIIKASEGTGYTDTKFSVNQSECRRVGLPLGYYHFARPELNNSAIAEADWFLKVCGTPVEGEVYALDYEANWSGDVVGWCKAFLDRVYQQINVKAFIYLNQSLTTTHDWKPLVDAGYGLWIAAYTGSPTNNKFKTGTWPNAAMQQWTNAQIVPGITGGIDGDCFFGDIDAFKKYGYHAVVIPPQPIPPSDELIQLKKDYEALQLSFVDINRQLKECQNNIPAPEPPIVITRVYTKPLAKFFASIANSIEP